METTVGIFQLSANAERARQELSRLGIADEQISLLSPGATDQDVLASVHTSDSEGSGMGGAMGGTVGGAVGAATGASLAIAAASLFLPGVGLVLVAGALGAALIGTSGAVAGALAGNALESELGDGLPHDDLYIYEDALRKGHTVMLVSTPDRETADRVGDALIRAGAETVDAAREDWWLGLQDAERERYEGDFEHDATHYRQGFESALRPKLRGKSFDDAAAQLDSEWRSDKAYRSGYERGQSYQRSLEENVRV